MKVTLDDGKASSSLCMDVVQCHMQWHPFLPYIVPSFSSISPGLTQGEPSFFSSELSDHSSLLFHRRYKKPFRFHRNRMPGEKSPRHRWSLLDCTSAMPGLKWGTQLCTSHYELEQYVCLQKKLKWNMLQDQLEQRQQGSVVMLGTYISKCFQALC